MEREAHSLGKKKEDRKRQYSSFYLTTPLKFTLTIRIEYCVSSTALKKKNKINNTD